MFLSIEKKILIIFYIIIIIKKNIYISYKKLNKIIHKYIQLIQLLLNSVVGLNVLVIHVVLPIIKKFMLMIMMVIGVITGKPMNGVVFQNMMKEPMMKFVGLNSQVIHVVKDVPFLKLMLMALGVTKVITGVVFNLTAKKLVQLNQKLTQMNIQLISLRLKTNVSTTLMKATFLMDHKPLMLLSIRMVLLLTSPVLLVPVVVLSSILKKINRSLIFQTMIPSILNQFTVQLTVNGIQKLRLQALVSEFTLVMPLVSGVVLKMLNTLEKNLESITVL